MLPTCLIFISLTVCPTKCVFQLGLPFIYQNNNQAAMAFLFLAIVSIYITVTYTAQDTCPIVQYRGSFYTDDHVDGHALTGYSYRNVTVSHPQKCFSTCVMDCRCLAYQLFGTRCEVMDEDRHTAPNQFLQTPGYQYFGLKQWFKTHVREAKNVKKNNYLSYNYP